MTVIERKTEEDSIDETLELAEKPKQELPVQSLFTGINMDGKKVNIKNAFLETPTLENYAKYSAIIRDYFAHADVNHTSFALLLGKMMSDQRKKGIESLLTKLEKSKKTMSREEVQRLFALELYGEDGKGSEHDNETKQLLSAMMSLYELNNSVHDRFKEAAKEQNPVFKLITTIESNYLLQEQKNNVATVFFGRDLAREDEDLTDRELDELETFIKKIENEGTTSVLNDDKMHNFNAAFDDKQYFGDVDREFALGKAISEAKTLIREKKLKQAHEEADRAARILLIRTFQSGENSHNLSSLFKEEGDNNRDLEEKREMLKEHITKSLLALKINNPSLAATLTPKTTEQIIRRLQESYIDTKDASSKDILRMIDDQSNIASKKTELPPNIIMEEVFMKIAEDTIYNTIMENNGGLENFTELVNITDTSRNYGVPYPVNNGVINIHDNLVKGRYDHPARGGKAYELAQDALNLWNTRTIAKSVSDGTVTKEEAVTALSENMKNSKRLTEGQKEAFVKEVGEKYNKPDFAASFDYSPDQLKGLDRKVGDDISFYNAKKLYSRLFKKSFYNSIGKNLKIASQAEIKLQGCIEAAVSPKISSHSSSSEINSCFDNYKKELQEEIKELEQAASHPVVALSGLSVLAILFAAYKRARTQQITWGVYNIERDRIRAIDFVNQAETPEDKIFRANVLKNEKFNVSDEVMDKSDFDDFIFKTAMQRHEFQAYKDETLSDAIDDIKGAKATEDISKEEAMAKALREGMASIFDKTKIKDNFNDFSVKQNEKLQKDFKVEFDKNNEAIYQLADEVEDGHIDNVASRENDIIAAGNHIVEGFRKGALKFGEDGNKDFNNEIMTVEKASQKHQAALRNLMETSKKRLNSLEKMAKTHQARYESLAMLTTPNGTQERERQRVEALIKDTKQEMATVKAVIAKTQTAIKTQDKLMTEVEYMKRHYDNNSDIFSQSVAFSDKDNSVKAMMARYSKGEFALNSVAQDLILLEQFQRENKDTFSQEQLESITSAKNLIREFYVMSEQNNSKHKRSKTDILKELYDKQRAMFTDTADVDFAVVDQSDETKVQAVYAEKANAKHGSDKAVSDMIKQAFDLIKGVSIRAVAQEKNSVKGFSDPQNPEEESKGDITEEDLQEALMKISGLTGIKLSKNAHVKGNKQDGSKSERATRSINNDTSNDEYNRFSNTQKGFA